MSERIYLAAPYSDPCPDVCDLRFSRVTVAAGELMRQGALVYSPLTMGHVIAGVVKLPGDWAFWRESCLSYLEEWATTLYVLRLPGWEQSQGVAAEVEAARKLRLPVVHLLPVTTPDVVLRVHRW